jgi:hypothetical protein
MPSSVAAEHQRVAILAPFQVRSHFVTVLFHRAHHHHHGHHGRLAGLRA